MFDGDISNFGAEFTDELTAIFDNGFYISIKIFLISFSEDGG